MSTFSNRIARKKKTENHEVKPGTTETTPAEVPAKPEKEKPKLSLGFSLEQSDLTIATIDET